MFYQHLAVSQDFLVIAFFKTITEVVNVLQVVKLLAYISDKDLFAEFYR